METGVTVYVHLGDKLMPKTLAEAPRPGESIEVRGLGRRCIERVERDEAGDLHLYLEGVPVAM